MINFFAFLKFQLNFFQVNIWVFYSEYFFNTISLGHVNPPVVLCGNLIIGVHGPFLSLKTEKVPVNHLNCPLSSRQVNKQNLCPMYDTVHAWFFYAGMLKPIFNVTRWVL